MWKILIVVGLACIPGFMIQSTKMEKFIILDPEGMSYTGWRTAFSVKDGLLLAMRVQF